MAYLAATNLSVTYESYASYFLKCYEQGTTTPLSMATDESAATLLVKAEVSAGGTVPIGYFKTAGDVIFQPYLNAPYDAWLFPTATEADDNDTSSAVQIADNITLDRGRVTFSFDNVAALKASDLAIGENAATNHYTTDGGGSSYVVVATGPTVGQINHTLSNGNVAVLFDEGSTIRAKQAGATGSSVVGTDDAAFTAVEADTRFTECDLEGMTINLSTSQSASTKNYFNGILYVNNNAGQTRELTSTGISDFQVARPRTKTPLLDWSGLNTLWVGTSIPHQGATIDNSYPKLISEVLHTTMTNYAWSSSHAFYDVDGASDSISTISALSMTEDDRLAGLALYGSGSAYDDSFDTITNASTQTCDYRIASVFADTHQDVVFLDHNHNDMLRAEGSLNPTAISVSGVTIGSTTTISLSDASTLTVGDSVTLEITGIDKLNYAAARIQSISTNDIALNIDSSGYAGTFSSGSAYLQDKATINGAFNFLISYILNQSIIHGNGTTATTTIILSGSPSMYTSNVDTTQVFSVGETLKLLAAKWQLSYFDITHEYDIKLFDNPTFFQDGIHPTTYATRKSLSNYWVKWCRGGATRETDTNTILGASSQAFTDNREALYTEIGQGFSNPSNLLLTGAQGLAEDWSGGALGSWTAVGDATTIGSAPWAGTDDAILCQALVAGNKKSYVERAGLTLGEHPRWVIDIELPVVSGLTTFSVATSSILNLASGTSGLTSAYGYLLQLVVSPTSVGLQFAYFNIPSSGSSVFTIVPIPEFEFAANTKYTLDLIIQKATVSGEMGSVLLKINDVVVLSKFEQIDNYGQVAIVRALSGIISTTTNQDLGMYWSNLDEHAQALTDYSARYTGTFPDNNGATITVVNGIIVTGP